MAVKAKPAAARAVSIVFFLIMFLFFVVFWFVAAVHNRPNKHDSLPADGPRYRGKSVEWLGEKCDNFVAFEIGSIEAVGTAEITGVLGNTDIACSCEQPGGFRRLEPNEAN